MAKAIGNLDGTHLGLQGVNKGSELVGSIVVLRFPEDVAAKMTLETLVLGPDGQFSASLVQRTDVDGRTVLVMKAFAAYVADDRYLYVYADPTKSIDIVKALISAN